MNTQFYESLKNNLLFKNTDITSLNLDEIKGRLSRIGEGEIIYREGAPSDSIYLVVSGQVNIIKKKMLGKAKSYIYNENEFFGNDEYFEETTRTSTAIALQDSYLIILSRQEIDNLIFQDNTIYLSLREDLGGIFDNSTEITVEEQIQPANEEILEIDKLITGEEIETENTPARIFELPQNKTEENTSAVLPAADIKEELISPEPETTAPDESTPIEETAEEIIPRKDADDTKDNFSLSEKDIADIENTFDSQPDANDDGIILSLSDEDAIAEALKGQSEPEEESVEKEQEAEKETVEAEDENVFVKSGDDEIIMNIDDDREPVIEESDFIKPEEQSEPDAVPEITIDNEQLEIIISENTTEPAELGNEIKSILSDDETGGEMNTQEVNKIIKAMELVNSTVKIDDLLTSIVTVATDLTNADRGTLYLVDKEKGELWSKVAMGTEPKEIRLKIGEGIAGSVAKSKKIENIKDVTQHPLFKKDVDKSSGYITKNMLCFPLKNKEDEVIGVLQLLNSKGGEFTEHDEEVLSMISINTAIALQNADLVEKLLTAERVSSLGKMTNFLIQDIKKPVLVSKRYTEHLKSKSLAPEVSQLVEMILSELTQVADLVQTTSSYAEGKAILRTSITGINGVLKDYIDRIEQFTVSRHCKIHYEPDKEINVKIDTKEFYQCFLHIVKNACDAMPDGGILRIKTRIADNSVKIGFEDQGLGIPESFIDKIFEPFMTHGKKEGSGLGLSITKKIIEAHQGTIQVKSSLGAGAEFTITLPAGAAIY